MKTLKSLLEPRGDKNLFLFHIHSPTIGPVSGIDQQDLGIIQFRIIQLIAKFCWLKSFLVGHRLNPELIFANLRLHGTSIRNNRHFLHPLRLFQFLRDDRTM